jgi:hypothetical protein
MVWLAWGVLSFIAAVLSFMWTSGVMKEPILLPRKDLNAIRVLLSVFFLLGLVVFILVLHTFYGWSKPGKEGAFEEIFATPAGREPAYHPGEFFSHHSLLYEANSVGSRYTGYPRSRIIGTYRECNVRKGDLNNHQIGIRNRSATINHHPPS